MEKSSTKGRSVSSPARKSIEQRIRDRAFYLEKRAKQIENNRLNRIFHTSNHVKRESDYSKDLKRWEKNFYHLHVFLMFGYLANVIIQLYGYGITCDDAICANVVHSMPLGKQMTSTIHKVANVYLIHYAIWPMIIMLLFHSVFVYSHDIFRDWYYLNIVHENGTIRHMISMIPCFFLTLIVASSVGVTDIYMLLVLGFLSSYAEMTMGLMEWSNSTKTKQQEECIAKMYIMFNGHKKNIENIYAIFEDPDGINWWEATLDRLLIPRVDWIHLGSCIFAHSLVVSVILGYYGHMLVKNIQDFQLWIFGAVIAYIAIIALQIFQTIGYWSDECVYLCYIHAVYSHLLLQYLSWTLIIFFVIAGGGGNSNAVSDGCLYPLA